ncbi:hypothetical protein ACS0TY_006597 [Phlomoides rotata]
MTREYTLSRVPTVKSLHNSDLRVLFSATVTVTHGQGVPCLSDATAAQPNIPSESRSSRELFTWSTKHAVALYDIEMTKKNSSKIARKNTQEGPCTKNQRPSLKPKKMGSEIDEIFAAKKRKRPENDEKKASTSEKPHKLSSSAKVKSNGKMRMVRDDGNENERENCRWAIFIYREELGFGKSDVGVTRMRR